MTLLITYASTRGSTREVAETIAASLREHGLDVDLKAAAEVEDVNGYDGVVLGAAIYTGHAHVDVRRLLRRCRKELSSLPLAVFAMGPRTSSEDDLAGSRKQLDHDLAKLPELEPFSIAIFGGVVDPAKLHFPFNRMAASDARDWDAIEAWALELAATFAPVPAAALAP